MVSCQGAMLNASPSWVLWQSPAAPYLAKMRSVWCPGQPGSFPEPRKRETLSGTLSQFAQQRMATYPASEDNETTEPKMAANLSKIRRTYIDFNLYSPND